MKAIYRVMGLGALSMMGATARAELTFGVEAGVGYSDNITRVDVEEIDEKIGTVGLDLNWNEHTQRIDGDAVVDLSYVEYLDDTYESEVVGTANGALTVGIVPERLTWIFQDTFGQAQTDPFAPVTPENREDLNYFTTGPDFIARFGSVASLRLLGRYSLTSYEESPLDAERRSAGLVLGRELSGQSEIALNLVREKIEFEDTQGDYERDLAFLSYEVNGARTDIITELGYTWVRPEVGEDTGGLLASLSVARTLSASSTLHLDLGTQFTDAGESMRDALEGGAVGGADITAAGEPFENRNVGLRWDFFRNRTGFSLGASWNEDRYEQTTDYDSTRMDYEASFSRRLGPTLDFVASVQFTDEEFDNTGLTAEELTGTLRFDWQPSRALGLALSFERSDRGSSDGLGEYAENRVFLLATYRPVRESGAPPASP